MSAAPTGYRYAHSEVFASLKNIHEGLSSNLTTSQYLQALDKYLQNATTPVIVGTRFFDAFLARLVGWQEKNFRRKVSFADRRVVPARVINFLLQSTPEGRIAAFEEIKLDRGIRMEALEVFYSRMERYEAACDCTLLAPGATEPQIGYCLFVKNKIEEEMRARVNLLTVLSESKFWLDRAVAFKALILEKYTRLCINVARADYVNYFKHSVSLNDLIHWYWIAASRAIDKCDSEQGALTSHIRNWFLTARSRVSAQRDQRSSELNIELLALDSPELQATTNGTSKEEEEDRTLRLHSVRYLARLADPLGVARAYLGIEECPEVLSSTPRSEINGKP